MLRRGLFLALLIALAAGSPAPPAGAGALPIPRFASLRSDKINLRVGPGLNFPVQWVYQRKHMPVEVIGEYDVWRKIRDWQGTIGWVHQSMLDGQRYALITGGERILHSNPDPDSPAVARVQTGVVAALLRCEGVWCRVDAGGYRGWLRRSQFFGVFPEERLE